MADIGRFCDEIELALTRCINEAAPKMAAKYDLREVTVAQVMPRLFMKVGIAYGLKQRGWDEDEILTLIEHFYMFLNGAQQWREDRRP
jgi:hypothetical protein